MKFTITAFCFILLFNFSSSAQSARLYQAAFNGTCYEFGYKSFPEIPISDAPEDTDWQRWSILYDGINYKLYAMPIGKSDKLYQFAFNPSTLQYEYGYNCSPITSVVDLPENANVTGFSILHDGDNYRLYFKTDEKDKIYQCGFDPDSESFVFGYNSIPVITISNAPENTDWNSWSMLHDGQDYRLYFKSKDNKNLLYQFGFNGYSYSYGYRSLPKIKVINMPQLHYVKKFNITFDGSEYRYYNLEKLD
jgi:hypothetical protein